MIQIHKDFHLSASDLSSHIACPHLTQLKVKVAKGELKAPAYYAAELDALRKKGEEMEQDFLDSLKAEDKRVVEIARDDREAGEKTLQAMREGVDVIYQARLKDGAWGGWADFLVKSSRPSPVLGNWSYEVVDTKLSRETKAGAILQICLYSDILARYQGVQPEYMYIRNPLGEEPYRVDDFMAYYRLMRRKLEQAVAAPVDTYPEPVSHCAVCDWFEHCNRQRRKDDHLSFIAGMGASQMREVRGWGVNTLEAMARLPMHLPQAPSRGSVETFIRLREQARVQLESRNKQETVYEVLEPEEGFGFYLLPAPSPGDIFLDFEGDPYVEPAGREYLFGWVFGQDYHHAWAESEAAEKKAFEDFVDGVMAIREKYPDMHIYHFAPYEPSALKRLMGKYATREHEIDTLLRAQCFVDLHTVVRQAVRAGVESYSLKDLEALHGFRRQRPLREVGVDKMGYEALLENGMVEEATDEMRRVIREYNEDDCRSTLHLRAWLEMERADLLRNGYEIPRPEPANGEAGENTTAHQERIRPLFEALMEGVPVDQLERSEEQQARWLLAHMLDWYRREKKSFWWEYFRLLSLPPEELLDERMAIGGLEYTGEREPVKRSVIDAYRFPPQDTDIRVGDTVRDQSGSTVGTVEDIDPQRGVLRIKRGQARADTHPEAVIVHQDIKITVKEEAIIRLAKDVIDHGMEGEGSNGPARALLLRQPPGASEAVRREKDPQQQAIRWVQELDGGVLPIQGPPGTGKSHTAAAMILELLRQGRTVGITALSHKVITGLLEKVYETARRARQRVGMVQKGGDGEGDGRWILSDDNSEVHRLLTSGRVQVAAGTPFMWSRPEFAAAVDVMFVDEAGQLSLIDTLALSHAAGSLVLLGDPQQLSQPQQGSHPQGTEVSALEHLLQEHKTIQPAQGVFLSETWRMHPAVCGYISELFYEGRLESRPENARQSLLGTNPFPTAGLAYAPVVHAGNRNASPEEVSEVQRIIRKLANGKTEWVDKAGKRRKLNREDILVIAPYNAQVSALAEALPGVRVGTVDKFQGQEAPVVIFSMATSSPEEAPRGMEFLYSLNRLNVAVSRAKTLCILVASEKLFEPDCRSPHQMRLANALCRFRERVGEREGIPSTT